MKANRMWLFSDVLEKNKRVFKVPVYQRNYDWTNIQCEKLFQDIMKAGENNRQHFTINANIRMYRNDHLKMYKITL